MTEMHVTMFTMKRTDEFGKTLLKAKKKKRTMRGTVAFAEAANRFNAMTGSVADNAVNLTSGAAKSVNSMTGGVAGKAVKATGSGATFIATSAVNVTGAAASTIKTAVLGADELSWEDLCRIEKTRRAILRRNGLPFWRILAFWDGTVLSALAHDSLFYITIVIYILVVRLFCSEKLLSCMKCCSVLLFCFFFPPT